MNCGGVRFEHDTLLKSPLAASEWISPWKGLSEQDSHILRRKIVSFAISRSQDLSERNDFGQSDLDDLFLTLKAKVDWKKDRPLSDLVRAAERRNAYDNQKLPSEGDIVLFHNQTDRNKNGKLDDWLTGCGIVIEKKDKILTVLTRSEHTPRLTRVTPMKPSVRSKKGTLLNSFLRIPKENDPLNTEYLAGALYAGRIDIVKLVK